MPSDAPAYAAVALAGGALEDDFRDAGYDVVNKAYLTIGDSTMLERVLRALHGASSVARIRCVTQAEPFRSAFGDAGAMGIEVVPPGDDLIESVLAGFEGLDPSAMVLACATDIPLATSAAIDGFARKASGVSCDVGYGYVSRTAHERAYPQIRHTWVRLREGTFCGSGISVLRAGAVAPLAASLRKIVAARKSPLRLASLISPWLILRLLVGTVGIPELEQRGSRILGVQARGILADDPALAVNVDRLEDLKAVEAIVNKP